MKNAPFKHLSVLFFASILASTLSAQQPVKRCGTVEYNKLKEQQNPALAEARQHTNQIIKQYMTEHASENTRSVVTIPVVIHVIYNINIQNISDAQIQSQIDVLNKDYGRLNSDTTLTPAAFRPVAANTGIQFCLATRDPNGNPTNGIERRQNTSVSTWSNNDEMKWYVTGGLDAWDRNKYLNIWVCTLGGTYLGYTQMPSVNADSTLDGCVVTTRAFGDVQYVSPPFHLGRTTTHEVGHWLGLYHPWGDDGGACPWNGGNDDFIGDTPPQASETNGCPAFPVYDVCDSTYPGIMFMNYMDYTDDACMNMFTQEQAAKMNAVIVTLRPAILTSDGCTPVGINELNHETEISVYPNPASNELRIKNSELKIESLEMYDFLGRLLLSQKPAAKSQQLVIDISSLAEGTYFLKITSPRSVRAARFTIAR